MFELSTEIIALLLGAAFVAGFVDAIAGGGGLITLPALLLAGVPPVTALATNKVQGLFGAGMAAITYARAGHVNLRRQLRAALLAFAGALLGALLASSLPTDVIRLGLPVLLIAVAVFFALKPGLDDTDKHERITPFVFTPDLCPVYWLLRRAIGAWRWCILYAGVRQPCRLRHSARDRPYEAFELRIQCRRSGWVYAGFTTSMGAWACDGGGPDGRSLSGFNSGDTHRLETDQASAGRHVQRIGVKTAVRVDLA